MERDLMTLHGKRPTDILCARTRPTSRTMSGTYGNTSTSGCRYKRTRSGDRQTVSQRAREREREKESCFPASNKGCRSPFWSSGSVRACVFVCVRARMCDNSTMGCRWLLWSNGSRMTPTNSHTHSPSPLHPHPPHHPLLSHPIGGP